MGKSAKIGRLPGFVNQKKLSQGKETKASKQSAVQKPKPKKAAEKKKMQVGPF